MKKEKSLLNETGKFNDILASIIIVFRSTLFKSSKFSTIVLFIFWLHLPLCLKLFLYLLISLYFRSLLLSLLSGKWYINIDQVYTMYHKGPGPD